MRKLLFLFVVTMLSVTAMAQDGSIKWNECVCGFSGISV